MFFNEVYLRDQNLIFRYVLFCLSKKELPISLRSSGCATKKDTRNQLLRDCGKQLCGSVVYGDLSFSNSILGFGAIYIRGTIKSLAIKC